MPVYDFKCNTCNKIEEYYVPLVSSPAPKCECNRKCELTKIESFSKSKPVLKGNGFYETDYKNK
jgi:putative FmdB family regulatory protein